MSKKKEKGEVIGLIGLGNVMFVVCINEQESAMWKCRQSNVQNLILNCMDLGILKQGLD